MKKIREGAAEILVPEESVTRKAEAFYNSAMEYQRDMTMSALRVFRGLSGKKISVCDPLAGTGIRGIRILLEVGGIGSVVFNDLNPKAAELIRKNIELNIPAKAMKKCHVSCVNAGLLFRENKSTFDYIDIDPFGSPLKFISGAGAALKSRSMLACTATDTGALCGTFAGTCLRRYGIKAGKTDFYKELGIRILITATMRELSGHGMAFEPVYSHANHYFRVVGLVRKSRQALAKTLKEIREVFYCQKCLFRGLDAVPACPFCGSVVATLGPLWTGKIKDNGFCLAMLADMRTKKYPKGKEIQLCIEEIEQPFYYDTQKLFRASGLAPKKKQETIRAIMCAGYDASPTHLSPLGIKTGASHAELVAILRKMHASPGLSGVKG